MSQNVSANGLKIVMVALPLMPTPIEIDNLSADTAPWDVKNMEVGGTKIGADGRLVSYSKNSIIEATLTLSGASRAGAILSDFAQRQRRLGQVPPISCNYTFTITNLITGKVETYADGFMVDGSAGQGVGTETLNDRSFTFHFALRS